MMEGFLFSLCFSIHDEHRSLSPSPKASLVLLTAAANKFEQISWNWIFVRQAVLFLHDRTWKRHRRSWVSQQNVQLCPCTLLWDWPLRYPTASQGALPFETDGILFVAAHKELEDLGNSTTLNSMYLVRKYNNVI